MNPNSLSDAAGIIRNGQSILVMAHVNPDGDSIGCMLAIGMAMEQIGKQVLLLSPDGVTDTYKFLPGSENIVKAVPDDSVFDLCIIVDCENVERVGSATQYLSRCNTIMEIDHHPGSNRSDGVNILDPDAASSGDIVYKLLRELNVCITLEIAECLMTAIVTDTGSFKFSNVKPDTLRIAADLLEAGASTGIISQKVYDTRSLASVKLLGIAIGNIQLAVNDKVAWSFVSRENLTETGALDSDTEGIVNYTRSIKGVVVGILFNEAPNNVTRVSFRARDGYDISQVARKFGGGGHKAASGATIEKPLNEAIQMVLDAVKRWMES
ncbi:MAG: DHH family phosphoesterase [Armatimonadota bacterium]